MSLAGELQGCAKHEAREANHAKRVELYARSWRFYKVEKYVQNYSLEKALWLWREWNRTERLETRVKLEDCQNKLGKNDADLCQKGLLQWREVHKFKEILSILKDTFLKGKTIHTHIK